VCEKNIVALFLPMVSTIGRTNIVANINVSLQRDKPIPLVAMQALIGDYIPTEALI
jgi:hypothetical protein